MCDSNHSRHEFWDSVSGRLQKERIQKRGIPLEAKTRDRGRSGLTSGGVADTGKIPMLLGNEGDGEAARGPREPSLVLDEAEGLPRGNGREGALASSVRSEQRTTASSGTVRARTRNLLCY